MKYSICLPVQVIKTLATYLIPRLLGFDMLFEGRTYMQPAEDGY